MPRRQPVFFQPREGQWLGWLGHRIRYLATTDETDGNYCISAAPVKAGGTAPPHRHDFEEGFYVLSGRVEFTAGNRTVELVAGEFVNIGGGTAHAPRALEDSDLLTIAAPAGFDQFQMQAGETLESGTVPLSKTRREVLASIHDIAANFGITMNPSGDAFEKEPRWHVARREDGDIVDAVGDRYRFLVEGEQSDGRYALWHATITPGGGPPLHTHTREDEAFFVLKGQLDFESDGQSFSGGPGTFVNLPTGSGHRFENRSGKVAEALILVAPAGLEKMFRRTGRNVEDRDEPVSAPAAAEKSRLLKIAPEFGIEIHGSG